MRIPNHTAVARVGVNVSDSEGQLHALDRRIGITLWSAPTGLYNFATPALADGVLYVGSEGNGLRALEAKTGALRWQQRAVSGVRTSPAPVPCCTALGVSDFGALRCQQPNRFKNLRRCGCATRTWDS
ncbi:outer membrane protein assembly factor BamB family protein [Azohydromonas australica]|uniref:outer membrane protein assembly factor BamB family protein n=1 Tax=Azohydromonas australica TaxID=364039 RepID=UPI0003F6C38C|nr:PQQ-binding-like beta-propeller repeat protein [Azohydromonas australica]